MAPSSLEFGFWTEDDALVQGLDPESDAFEPELLPVAFDDEAFREVLAEMNWDDEDDDPF